MYSNNSPNKTDSNNGQETKKIYVTDAYTKFSQNIWVWIALKSLAINIGCTKKIIIDNLAGSWAFHHHENKELFALGPVDLCYLPEWECNIYYVILMFQIFYKWRGHTFSVQYINW